MPATLFSGTSFPVKIESEKSAFEDPNMPPEFPPEIVKYLKDHPEESVELYTSLIKPLIAYSMETIKPIAMEVFDQKFEASGLSEEVNGLVSLLAAKSNDSRSEVLRKALTLYGLAIDALEKGNRIAILNSKDQIIHDVIGFESGVSPFGKVAG